MRLRIRLVLLAFTALTPAAGARAQFPTRPWLDWRTIETPHFAVHTPRELEDWSRHMAARLEDMRGEVVIAVGHAPARRVQVVVDDPYSQANGSAWPMLDFPMMVLWPVAPSPRSAIGNYDDWSRLLATHEFAHVAHLTYRSRNGWQRFVWSLMPVPLGPVARKSPRWAIEGYATYIEGRLTGSGRPYGAYRPAILREWAIEGRLPTYAQMSGSSVFQGGSFAYLNGSAFIEWLARRGGDSSVAFLWRRMSARTDRTFPQAFEGLYGLTPEAAYGRFSAELTHDALEFERAVRAAGGPLQGVEVQHLAWTTGDPALSPDGRQVAISIGSAAGRRRLVVLSADSAPTDTARMRRLRQFRTRDPLDVPDSQFHQRPRKPLATLWPRAEMPFEEPRFMPGGLQVLTSRLVPQSDGTLRPDLFLWTWKSGAVRQVTHRSGVRQADPSPDGRHAIATRCTGGSCALVLVSLSTGATRVLRPGSFGEVYYRPRWSPDGSRIAVTVLQTGRWRVALTDTAGSAPRFVDPEDGASRYDAAFADSGRALVVVSERGGVMNLERIDLGNGATRTLTRVTGAALAPEPNRVDGSTWFLSLHADGLDLRKLEPPSTPVSLVEAPASLAPAVPVKPAFRARLLDTTAIGPSHAYRLGPSQRRWLPLGASAADGSALELAVERSDPVGRLSALLAGSAGSAGAWNGARAAATWRGLRPELRGDLFTARQDADSALTRLTGGALRISVEDLRLPRLSAALTLSSGNVRAGTGRATPSRALDPAFARTVAVAQAGIAMSESRGKWSASQSAAIQSTLGHSQGAGFTRTIGSVGGGVKMPFLPALVASARAGTMSGDAPFERFTLGGPHPLLFDETLLSQRIFFAALPTAGTSGSRFMQARGALQLGFLQPFYWTASVGDAGERLSRWTRAYGIEMHADTPPMTFVAVPGLSVSAGVARVVEERKTRFYLGTSLRP